MTEVLERSLSIPETLYSRIGQRVLENVGLSLVDFAEQNPASAYLTIVDFAAVNAHDVAAILGEDNVPAATKNTDGQAALGGMAEHDVRRHFLHGVAGKRVNMTVSLLQKPRLRDVVRGHSPQRQEILSFVADLSLVDQDTLDQL